MRGEFEQGQSMMIMHSSHSGCSPSTTRDLPNKSKTEVSSYNKVDKFLSTFRPYFPWEIISQRRPTFQFFPHLQIAGRGRGSVIFFTPFISLILLLINISVLSSFTNCGQRQSRIFYPSSFLSSLGFLVCKLRAVAGSHSSPTSSDLSSFLSSLGFY